MTMPRSLQGRLVLTLGILLMVIWVGAAWATAVLLRHEVEEVFDSALQETAQRLLPLAVLDVVGREDGDTASQRLGTVRSHDELFTYIVRNSTGDILLRSHAADLSVFPAYDGPGFRKTPDYRLYSEEALQGSISITVAQRLEHQRTAIREVQMGLGLPILLVIPAAFAAIAFSVSQTMRPLRQMRAQLETRNENDLAAVSTDDLPSEVAPLAASMNALLERLRAAFDAERSLATNTAHELRTPLAGAIAQAQRIRKETAEPLTAQRGADIEAALKRLTARAERLMQLARAEGGRLKLDRETDLRETVSIIAQDLQHTLPEERIMLRMPDTSVLSTVDPDAAGIIVRNLLENALQHGDGTAPVDVSLSKDGVLSVANDGAMVVPERLKKLAARFERDASIGQGSGIGLSIVSTIAARIGSRLELRSPRPGHESGFEASVWLTPPSQPLGG